MSQESSYKFSKLKKVEHFIKDFDYFGVNLNFHFKKEEKYKSVIGGISYILFLIFAIIYLIINFKEFITRTQLNLIFNQGIYNKAPAINLTDHHIGLALAVTADEYKWAPILEKYFKLEFNHVSLKVSNRSVVKTKSPINLIPCTYENFNYLANKTFDVLNLQMYSCPEMAEYNISGIYTDNLYDYFEFVISLMPEYYNDTSEIRNVFLETDIKFNVMYLDTSITVYDYQNPLSRMINNDYGYLDWQFLKRVNMDFIEFNFFSDDNLIVPKANLEKNVILDGSTSYFTYIGEDRFISKPKDFNIFSKVYFRSATSYIIIKRVYMKLTTYLADMSGLLSLILLILLIAINSLNNFKANQSIIKKIFKFKENQSLKNLDIVEYMKEKFSNVKESKINL